MATNLLYARFLASSMLVNRLIGPVSLVIAVFHLCFTWPHPWLCGFAPTWSFEHPLMAWVLTVFPAMEAAWLGISLLKRLSFRRREEFNGKLLTHEEQIEVLESILGAEKDPCTLYFSFSYRRCQAEGVDRGRLLERLVSP
jgi:hypothetical protein